ncbi:uncharacterized protein LOC121383504, partial [Gigantopelta aegis]|uniref:uncharacterized protein LOC121383504 n=1 Tax=Gigantopelta aegis TaxID=1735272 RepID=UPI001B88D2E7
MNNFFCGLHLLVGCADVCATAMKKIETFNIISINTTDNETNEQQIDGGDELGIHIIKGNESGAAQLIRCCSIKPSLVVLMKNVVFMEPGSCTVTYKNIKYYFNLLSTVVYFHRERILTFLENFHGVTNGLLQQIVLGLKNYTFVAGCRAFGLSSKQITSPLWRLIEGKIHILKMNKQYLDLCKCLENLQIVTYTERFVAGDNTPFDTVVENDDIVHKELVKSGSSDSLTERKKERSVLFNDA